MNTGIKNLKVKLSALVPHPSNRRKIVRPAEAEAMAASLQAHDLINPLRVVPSPKKGEYYVVAGLRRRAGFQLLADRGDIDPDPLIDCRMRVDDDAASVALAENVIRWNLDVMDEAEQYAEVLADPKKSTADVAKAFSVTEKHVKQRIKLAALAEEVKDAFRGGDLTLDVAQTLTLCDTPEQQVEILRAIQAQGGQISAYRVREMVRAQTMPASHPVVRFVGIEAYREAGGTFVEDLFAGIEHEPALRDVAIVHRIASEKLAELAAKEAANGWRFVETRAGFFSHWQHWKGYFLDDDMIADTDEMEELQDLLAEMTGEDPDRAEVAARLAALEDMEAKARAASGVVIYIDNDGQPALSRYLLRQEDHDDLIKQAQAEAETGDEPAADDDGEDLDDADEPDDDDGDEEGEGTPKPFEPAAAAPHDIALNHTLRLDLSRERMTVARHHLAKAFEPALNLFLCQALSSLFLGVYDGAGLHIRITTATNHQMSQPKALGGADALVQEWGKLADDLRDRFAVGGSAALYGTIAALPIEERHQLFAICIAATLPDALADNHKDAMEAALAHAGADLRSVWTPGEDFLNRFTKADLSAIHRQTVGWEMNGTAKKPDMVSTLASLFDRARQMPEAPGANALNAWTPSHMAFGVWQPLDARGQSDTVAETLEPSSDATAGDGPGAVVADAFGLTAEGQGEPADNVVSLPVPAGAGAPAEAADYVPPAVAAE